MPIMAGGTAFMHKLDSLKVVSARSSGKLVSLFGTTIGGGLSQPVRYGQRADRVGPQP
jgi:hypothetical protein